MALPLAAVGPSPLWYLARGTGAVTLVLLTASVVIGILGRVGWTPGPRTPRFVVEGLHRNLSLLVLALLGVHVATSVLDPFAHIHLLDAFVPLHSGYRPLWLGFGALALDILLAIAITSLVRRRLGLRAWKAVHWAAYACWPVALVHGLGTGTDASTAWLEALTAVCVAAVLAAVVARMLRAGPANGAKRAAALGGAGAVLLGIAIFAAVGPLRPGWARRSGTPVKLLASVRPVSASRTAAAASAANRPSTASARKLTAPFTAALTGTLRRSSLSDGNARADVSATLRSAGGAGRLVVAIIGSPLDSGGIQMSASRVTLATGSGADWSGRIVALDGRRMLARLDVPGARPVDLLLALRIAGDGTVTGTASAREASVG